MKKCCSVLRQMYACMHAYMYVCMYLFMYVYMYLYMYVCMYVCENPNTTILPEKKIIKVHSIKILPKE